jgi:transcriptional regulator NrdR family protein
MRIFGITQIRMALAHLKAKQKNREKRLCDVCNREFITFEATEEHRRKVHPNVEV